ncbi:hypothetical protein Lal_00021322 [Lupinus albus]|nr:hypothetical protein Lal_00021322 [Lupinus albus]
MLFSAKKLDPPPAPPKPPDEGRHHTTLCDKVLDQTQPPPPMMKRDLVAENLMTITYEEGNVVVPHVSLDTRVFNELCSLWKDALVVTLVGKTLSYNVLMDRLKRIWKLQGSFDMVDVDHGFYYVKFDLMAD